MTKVEGEANIWSIDIDTDKYQNIIFTRVNGSGTVQDWGAKTEDLVIPTDGKNFFTLSTTEAWDGNKATGTWSVYTPAVTHTFAKNSTLYIDFRAITDKKGANYPKAGSVGIDYSANAGGTVIPVTFTADVKWTEGAEFMKTEKGGWASIPFKAPEAGQNCAQVAADGKSYTWTTYSEPSVTLSLDKTEADAGTEVTVTLTATADNVSGEVTYAFQYSTDNATWNNITATDNTATQTFAAETRYYKVTMTNGGTTKEATAKFSAIKFHVIGSWDSWAAHNEVVEGSKTITLEANKTYEYKITDGTWDNHWGNDGTMDRSNCTDWSFESDNNAKIKTDEAGDYVFNVSRNAEGKVKVSVTYPELSAPIPTYDYYLTGSLVGGWDVKQQGIEKDAELYKATFTELNAGIYEFKITAGDWEHQWNYNNLGAAYEEVSQGVDGEGNPNGNIKIVTEEAKNITVIFDGSKITFEGLTPYVAPLTYTVTVPAGTEKCYIAGAFAQSNWNTFLEMEQVVGEDKFTITITGAKETDEYKYACQADWAYAEVIDGGGNRTNWSELDEVTAWCKPVVVTYQLKGVGGWDQPGIELVQNPGNDKEYMLTCQAISATDAVKVVRLEDGVIKDYYGNGTVKDEVTVAVSYDGEANIKLPEGKYNFYFDTNASEKKLWIEAATDCVTEPTLEVIRTGLTDGQWGTLCPDQKVTDMQGASFYTLTYLEMKDGMPYQLFFDEITTNYLEAGKPYLFIAEGEEIKGVKSGEGVDIAYNYNGFCGNVSGNTISLATTQTEYVADGDVVNYYGVINSRFTLLGNGTTVAHERAYVQIKNGQLDCPNPPASLPALAPGARRVVAGATGINTATGVDQVEGDEVPTKMIINGQLYILRGEKMYDAQGKLVK